MLRRQGLYASKDASMPLKFSRTLKDKLSVSGVSSAIREYERRYRITKRGGLESRRSDYRKFSDLYYDLVTSFYEYGWGRSFHFAPRVPGESFKASIARHEHYLAHVLGLRPGMIVADLGCGVGGPLLEIARFSGASIVGVNSNAHQLGRARKIRGRSRADAPGRFPALRFPARRRSRRIRSTQSTPSRRLALRQTSSASMARSSAS